MPGVKVPPRGPSDARVMVIGEAPGANEERLGQPFVGPAGQLLEGLLMRNGINPARTRFTNLTGYRPYGNDFKTFLTPGGLPKPELLEGLKDLHEEIKLVKPTLILALGNYPLRYTTGKGHWGKEGWAGISDYRGYVYQGIDFVQGIKVIPTFHPAYLLRQYSDTVIVNLDLKKAAAESKFPEIKRRPKTWVLDPRGQEREHWKQWLLADMSKVLTLDIEFIGNKLLCVGMTVESHTGVVIGNHEPEDVLFVKSILESGIKINAQNAMFDISILEWHYGINCIQYLVYDTMIAAHATYIELQKDLGFLASVWTDAPYWKDMVNWDKIKSGEQPFETVYLYNAHDVVYQHEIMEQQLLTDLSADDMVMKTFKHEMSIVDPLWRISKRGVRIDTVKLATLSGTLDREIAILDAGLTQLAGYDINVKSGPQVSNLLHSQLGLPILAKTPTGKPKCDDGTLAELSLRASNDQQRKALKIIRKNRERRDLQSKFCNIELDDDGRMRCHYDPSKTVTGRLSSRKFYPTNRGANLQNIPRDPRVRAVFVPDPGKLFGYADLMQAESIVVSKITQDPEMLRIHETPGLDGHKYVAAFLFNKPYESVTSEERFLGKKTRHACNYGLGWKKFMMYINSEAQETGVSITAAQAKVIVEKYRRLHPYLESWWREVETEIRRTKTLYTLLGRKRVFFDRVESMLPEAIAYNPQGTIADVLNMGLLNCDRSEELRGYGFEMLLQVHDAIGYQFDPKYTDEVGKALNEFMKVPLVVPKTGETFYIPVEVKVGENWGDSDYKSATPTNPNGLRLWNAKTA